MLEPERRHQTSMVKSSSHCLKYEYVIYPWFYLLCIKMGSTVHLNYLTDVLRYIKLNFSLKAQKKSQPICATSMMIQNFIHTSMGLINWKTKVKYLFCIWLVGSTWRFLCGPYFIGIDEWASISEGPVMFSYIAVKTIL